MSGHTSKIYLVTGGAQGIGRAIVEYLLQRDALLVIADHDVQAGEELAAALDRPERVLFVPTDVGSEESGRDCVRQALARFGGLDGLVNNAGIAQPARIPVTELRLDDWERILRVNLTGAMLMAKHAAPHLRLRHGAIINIASTRALQSEPDTEAYSASKGGLVSLTHALAASFAPASGSTPSCPAGSMSAPCGNRASGSTPVCGRRITTSIPWAGSVFPATWPRWWPFCCPGRPDSSPARRLWSTAV